ncbi:hypothetical protein [Oceanobacillus kimchii]|uniref:Uncharacterized protein n=1 Tax=Oceanobacillus kimchii TaxID=746691 RepID=A0ABQ5TM80_9BACI|nr:hypothetical protein [Oceanobacillus kimchii]GLO66220.1 hypothetical protein MACH08_20040 [Oceanobacillus kimchii]
MLNVGDKVNINSARLGLKSRKLEVIEINNPDYLEYVGEHVSTIDRATGERFVLQEGDYEVVKEKLNFGDLFVIGDNNIVYSVAGFEDDLVCYVNEYGERKVVLRSYISKVDPEDLPKYFSLLQGQIHQMRKMLNDFVDRSSTVLQEIKKIL